MNDIGEELPKPGPGSDSGEPKSPEVPTGLDAIQWVKETGPIYEVTQWFGVGGLDEGGLARRVSGALHKGETLGPMEFSPEEDRQVLRVYDGYVLDAERSEKTTIIYGNDTVAKEATARSRKQAERYTENAEKIKEYLKGKGFGEEVFEAEEVHKRAEEFETIYKDQFRGYDPHWGVYRFRELAARLATLRVYLPDQGEEITEVGKKIAEYPDNPDNPDLFYATIRGEAVDNIMTPEVLEMINVLSRNMPLKVVKKSDY